MWQAGLFGNKIRTWNSLNEILESEYRGTVTMRYKGSGGGGFTKYEVPIKNISATIEEWADNARVEGKQFDPGRVTFNESAPDDMLIIQGEVTDMHPTLPAGAPSEMIFWMLNYSCEKKKMRDAMAKARHAYGIVARTILENAMTPQSFSDMQELIEMYPDHVIEFGVYEHCLGNIPGRNAVIWEVRKY